MSAQEKPPAKLRSLVENHSYLLTTISTLISVLAPAGYISGYTYHMTYLHMYGVSSDVFELAATEAYTNSFYVVFLYMADWMPEVFSLEMAKRLSIGILIFTLVIFMIFRAGRWIIEKQDRSTTDTKYPYPFRYLHPKNNDLSKVAIAVAQLIVSFKRPANAGLIVVLIWMAIPAFSGLKAQDLAKASIQGFMEKGCVQEQKTQLSTCTKLVSKDNRVLVEGLLVAVSGNKAAFFTQQGSLILTVPTDAHLVRELMPSALSDKTNPETTLSIAGGDSAQ